jgi:hypothetical protein
VIPKMCVTPSFSRVLMYALLPVVLVMFRCLPDTPHLDGRYYNGFLVLFGVT